MTMHNREIYNRMTNNELIIIIITGSCQAINKLLLVW